MTDPTTPRARQPDGTGDLAWGLMFLMFALMARASQWVHGNLAQVAVMYAVIAVFWLANRYGLRAIRARLIYRRSGYVRFRQRPWILAAITISSSVVAGIYAFCMARMGTDILGAPLVRGLFFSLLMATTAVLGRYRPYIVYAILSTLFGIGVQLWHSDVVADSFWYMLLMGIAFLAGGAITLFLFVRYTPTANVEEE